MGGILIVDDQENVREWIFDILREMGFEKSAVRQAGGVSDAISSIMADMPDLLLLDVMFQDGNGFDVLESVKDQHTSMQVIVMTGFPQFDFAYQAVNHQVSAFLVKPFRAEELKRQVSVALHKEVNNSDRQQVALALLDSYLNGQSIAVGTKEIWNNSGIGRLEGEYYVVIVVNIEPSRRIEERTHVCREKLNKAGIRCVMYFRNVYSMVIIFRTERPEEELAATERILEVSYGWYSAGAAWIVHHEGLRTCYEAAVFAFDYAREMKINRQIMLYPKLDVSQIIIHRFWRRLCSMTESEEIISTVESMTMELARYRCDPGYAYACLCQNAQLSGEKIDESLDIRSLGMLSITLKRALLERQEKEPIDPRISRIIDYIEHHYMEDISRTSIAEALNISYSYLGELFRTRYTEGVKGYIDTLRLQHAAEMLAYTKYNIDEIAGMCGYGQSRQFAHRFKQRYGLTPSEYRQRETGRKL